MMRATYDFSQGTRGAIDPIVHGKTRITIRIDDDILEWFRNEVHAAGGGNYQTLINHVLREYIEARAQRLEENVRRGVRKELSAFVAE